MTSSVVILAAGFLAGCVVSALLPIASRGKSAPKSSSAKRRDVMSSAIEHRLLQGPQFVCLGGGTGLSTLLAG